MSKKSKRYIYEFKKQIVGLVKNIDNPPSFTVGVYSFVI